MMHPRRAASSERTFWTEYGFYNMYSAGVYIVSLSILCGVLMVRVHFKVAEQQEDRTTSTKPPEAEDIINVRPNEQGDGTALFANIVMNMALLPAMFGGFLLLRRRHPALYDGRRQVLESKPRRQSFKVSYTSLQTRVVDPEADRVIQAAGLDGWMLLRFYTLNCRILSTVGYILMMTLCPLHVFGGNNSVDALSHFGINSIKEGTERTKLLWVHASLVWLVVLMVGSFLLDAQCRFLNYRYGWLGALPQSRAATVIVENIPSQYRTDATLHAFFASVFPGEAVKRAYVVRRVPDLAKRLQELRAADESLRHFLEASEADKAGMPFSEMQGYCDCWCSTLVRWLSGYVRQQLTGVEATEESLRSNLERKRDEFRKEQQRVEARSRTASPGRRFFSKTGFVTFTSRRWQSLALERRYRADAMELAVDMPPDPSDVVYKDLALRKRGACGREACGVFSLLVVFVTWVPITIALSGLTVPSSLESAVPWLATIVQSGILDALFGGFVATLLLKTFMAIMPNILWQIIIRCFPLKAGSWAQLRLQEWYYVFQVIFVVLAAAFSRSLIQTLAVIVDNPSQMLYRLESQLPTASNFYLSYAVLGWWGTMIYLLRPIALAKYSAFRTVTGKDDAVARAQDEHPAFFGTGVRMTKASTMTTVTLVFCMLSPLICFFSLVFFIISRAVYGYLLLRAEEKRPDLGGAYWVKALDQVFFGLFLFVVVMVGILSIRGPGQGPGILAATSLFPFFYLRRRFKDMEWKTLPLEKVVELDNEALDGGCAEDREEGGKYMQPECIPWEELTVQLERDQRRKESPSASPANRRVRGGS